MVQLDYDENEEPRHAEHGNVPIQLEVQRATKWAEMWALYVAERLRASASSTEAPPGGYCFGVNSPRERRGI